MKQLIQNTEQLIADNDFVVIPGFGGFVAETRGAAERGGAFYPPSRVLGFNRSLTHNDGLLAQQYVKNYGVSYQEANLMIAGAVNELNRCLINFSRLRFGSAGTFSLSGNALLFEPSAAGCPSPSAYGLGAVYFPRVARQAETAAHKPEKESENKTAAQAADGKGARKPGRASRKAEFPAAAKSISISESAKENAFSFSKGIAAAAAIFLLMVLFPIGIQDGNVTDYASLAPIAAISAINSGEAETAVAEEPACTPYHVIIASFKTRSRANKFLRETDPALSERCTLIYCDNRFRISCNSFATEEDAEGYISEFIKDYPGHYDAWVLNYNP